jgi:DNA-binding NtrC family response regulator
MKNEFDGLIEYLLKNNIFMQEAIELLERKMIGSALTQNEGNQSATSKQLGIHRNTLQRKMLEYELGNGRRASRKPAVREARGRRKRSAIA